MKKNARAAEYALIDATAKPEKMHLFDARPAKARVLKEGNGICGTAHFSELKDGLWVCRKCERVVEIVTVLKENTKKHLVRTGQKA